MSEGGADYRIYGDYTFHNFKSIKAKLLSPILVRVFTVYGQNGLCVPFNFETLIGNFEVEKSNLEMKLRKSKLNFKKEFSNLP